MPEKAGSDGFAFFLAGWYACTTDGSIPLDRCRKTSYLCPMKQFLTIVILLVFTLASSGYTLNVHYCCGKIDSISWKPRQSASCQHGTGMKDGPCCADRSVHLDVDDSVPAAPPEAPEPGLITLPTFLISLGVDPVVPAAYNTAAVCDSSPPAEPPLTILHCHFRI